MVDVDKIISNDDAPRQVTIKLGHNFSPTHPVAIIIQDFAANVERESNNSIKVDIFPNTMPGGDADMMELLKRDDIQMLQVSAGFVEDFSPLYSIFEIPFLFENADHYHRVMGDDVVRAIYASNPLSGFRAIAYFDAGARSFYTKKGPILSPNDLKGLRIRVAPGSTQAKIVAALGATPVALPFWDVKTALQKGAIDGAENNLVSYVDMGHNEWAKFFSEDEHTRIPDLLLINTVTWNKLSVAEKNLMVTNAKGATDEGIALWKEATQKARVTAINSGVKFYQPNKRAFMDAMKPILIEQEADQEKKVIIDKILAMR